MPGKEISLPNQEDLPTKSLDLESTYEIKREKIAQLYNDVWVWHGTRRFNQTQGEINDILSGILNIGFLVPNQDYWNGSETVETISATISRPYATHYSDLHLNEGASELEFQDPRTKDLKRLTLARHLSPSYLPNLIRNVPSLTRTRNQAKEWMRAHRAQIPDNYSILVGFSDRAFEPIKTQKYLEASEVRTGQPIPIQYVTHIEVPKKNVQETEDLVAEKGQIITVIPREFGEMYQTEFSISDIISGVAFRQD